MFSISLFKFLNIFLSITAKRIGAENYVGKQSPKRNNWQNIKLFRPLLCNLLILISIQNVLPIQQLLRKRKRN